MKKFLKIIAIVLIAVVLLIALFFKHFVFFDIDHIPRKGEYYASIQSPYDRDAKLNIYYNPGNATGGSWTRVELEVSEQKRNLYFQSNKLPNEGLECKWLDKNTVRIDGHTIKTENGYYDYREHLEHKKD